MSVSIGILGIILFIICYSWVWIYYFYCQGLAEHGLDHWDVVCLMQLQVE